MIAALAWGLGRSRVCSGNKSLQWPEHSRWTVRAGGTETPGRLRGTTEGLKQEDIKVRFVFLEREI